MEIDMTKWPLRREGLFILPLIYLNALLSTRVNILPATSNLAEGRRMKWKFFSLQERASFAARSFEKCAQINLGRIIRCGHRRSAGVMGDRMWTTIGTHFFKRITTLGASLAIGVAFLAAQANAVPLTWYLKNAAFNDGGIAAGSFVFDADTGVISNISVTTSGGSITGHTYSFSSGFSFGDELDITTASGDLTNVPWLGAYLVSNMRNAGGTIDFDLLHAFSGEGICSDSNCITVSKYREWVSGSVTTVPLPGTLPLFASGAGLLGFLGWRRRKRKAALV